MSTINLPAGRTTLTPEMFGKTLESTSAAPTLLELPAMESEGSEIFLVRRRGPGPLLVNPGQGVTIQWDVDCDPQYAKRDAPAIVLEHDPKRPNWWKGRPRD